MVFHFLGLVMLFSVSGDRRFATQISEIISPVSVIHRNRSLCFVTRSALIARFYGIWCEISRRGAALERVFTVHL